MKYRVFFMLWDVRAHVWATEWLTEEEMNAFDSRTVMILYTENENGEIVR